jgi:hypothetical protein
MLYNQIVHTAQVSIQNPAGGPNVVFASAPATTAPTYGLGFGQMPTAQDGHAGHVDVPANGAVQIGNLLTCAAVTYIYTNAMGAVQNVVLYHAHTGFIQLTNCPPIHLATFTMLPLARFTSSFARRNPWPLIRITAFRLLPTV